ncbi:hypothetical protein [Actinocorallia populi]|uniref:hypothetical protein n=1 Tax=Actinocorallia populi TaxID=2079200 RepID=UPI000D091A05|nr:hypothetical protein [Actinocorallia populi]
MSRATRFALASAASVAAVAMTATAAHAWTGGSVSASLSQPLTVSLAGATCTTSNLSGNLASGGGLTITSATVSGCTALGLGVTVTPQNLPWSGSLTDGGGPATFSGFQLRARQLFVDCLYGGDIAGVNTGVTAGAATVTFTDAPVDKISGGGICPDTAEVSGQYTFTGPGL